MSEFLDKLSPGDVPGVIAIISTFVVALGWIVVSNWRKVRIAEQNAALKQDMIQRGMSVDDIERVLRARTRA